MFKCTLAICMYNKHQVCTLDGVRGNWIECNKVVNVDTKKPHITFLYGCNQECGDWGTKTCKYCSSSGKY